MTSFSSYYRDNVTWVGDLDLRLSAIADIVTAEQPDHVLDLGCGEGVLLEALASRLGPEWLDATFAEPRTLSRIVLDPARPARPRPTPPPTPS